MRGGPEGVQELVADCRQGVRRRFGDAESRRGKSGELRGEAPAHLHRHPGEVVHVESSADPWLESLTFSNS